MIWKPTFYTLQTLSYKRWILTQKFNYWFHNQNAKIAILNEMQILTFSKIAISNINL